MGRYFTKHSTLDENGVVSAIKQWAYPLESKADLEPLFDRIGDSRIVMLGEASHGTHEYYHRAIGVVYNPQYEQYGNYVPTVLPLRYDAFIYLDEATALHPLHMQPDGQQMPETYPFGV